MHQSLTILTTGRNDDYDGDFVQRLLIAMGQNMQKLPDAKFVFVEWNPIPNKTLVCEDLKKIFGDKITYYVAHPDFHTEYCTFDYFNEYPAKNIAIRRAETDFVLSINSDIILSPDVVEKLKQPLHKGVVYRAVRVDIRPDYLNVRFPLHPKFIVGENNGYMNACGDFLLMDRDSWHNHTGYMEIRPEQRLHKDSELVYRTCDLGGMPIEFLGQITHWRHKSSWSACDHDRPKVGDIYWDFKKENFTKNADNWGLSQAVEEDHNGITWLMKEKESTLVETDYSAFNAPLIQKAEPMRTALVLGGHGFIGHHMARRLKAEGYWVRTVDIKEFPYGDLKPQVDDYVVADLRDFNVCKSVFRGLSGQPFNEVYQFSAWMGGAGVIFTGDNDARIVHDSLLLNINAAEMAKRSGVGKIFFSSSACVYNQLNQENTDDPITAEDSAYPAFPDSDYGFEKLMSERIFQAYARNHKMDVRIARFHNVMGPEGAWGNGREKSPAAMCRKIAETPDGGVIEVWGDGEQTRSYLYIDEALEGVRRLMASDFIGPVNIGSEEMVSINSLVELVKKIGDKPNITIKHIPGPVGVRGRRSDNKMIRERLCWEPNYPLVKALKKTYPWILAQVQSGQKDCPWSN